MHTVPPTKACLLSATPAGLDLCIQDHDHRHLPSAVPWISEDRLLFTVKCSYVTGGEIRQCDVKGKRKRSHFLMQLFTAKCSYVTGGEIRQCDVKGKRKRSHFLTQLFTAKCSYVTGGEIRQCDVKGKRKRSHFLMQLFTAKCSYVTGGEIRQCCKQKKKVSFPTQLFTQRNVRMLQEER